MTHLLAAQEKYIKVTESLFRQASTDTHLVITPDCEGWVIYRGVKEPSFLCIYKSLFKRCTD